MENLYVSALWSDYHNLSSSTTSAIHATEEEANANCRNASDKIFKFHTQRQAERYVNALNRLCAAAWTPNQTPEEKEENGEIIRQTQPVLDESERLAVETLNPWDNEA